MKLIVYLLFSILCISVQAQILQDNFSDGNFTTNPIWTGDAADFIINSSLQLQSDNLGVSSSSELSTVAAIQDSTIWEFYVQMDFAPSTSNYALVYLQSDNANLSNTSNGYYLRIGSSGSTDSIEIYRLDAGVSTKVFGGAVGAVATNPTVRCRIIRNNIGFWEVFVDYSGGINYALEGSFTDANYNSGSYFGFKATYTTTRGDKFFFDDVSISPLVVDVIPPSIDSVAVLTATSIDIYFDEAVDLSTASISTNYTIDNGISVLSAARDAVDFKLVHLSLSSMQSGSSYNLTVNAVEDLNNNASVNLISSFNYFNIQSATFQDVIINEVFADPSPVVALPAFEYVELMNRSTSVIDLGGMLFNDGSDKLIPSYLLQPDSVVLLTAAANVASFSAYGPVLGLSSMTITNGGEKLQLKDAANNTIDSIIFDLSWYQDPSKEPGGWSIELVNPNLICQGASNWRASINSNGGTPAQQNSVYDVSPDLQGPALLSANFNNSTSVVLLFDEQLDPTSANDANNYTIPGLTISSASFTAPNQVLLTVSPMVDQTTYNITIVGLSDCSGNTIGASNTASFVYYSVQTAAFQDIIINEIFADPSPPVNLPNAEFVELYNRSNKTIDLNGMVFNDGSDHVLAAYLLFPDSFVILTAAANVGSYAVYGSTISTGSMTLTNSGELLQLKSSNGTTIDSVQYDDAWYADATKEDGGWSLELVNPNLICQGADNWQAALSNNGGTPGQQNSIFSNIPDLQGPLLVSANFIDSNRIQLSFNETLGANATTLTNYTVSTTTINTVTLSAPQTVVLELSNNMVDQTNYVVTVNALTDCSGNSILASTQDSFVYYEVQPAALHDLIFTEIMADPSPVVGLPDAEYLELYNRSNKTIDLSNFSLFESTNHTLAAQIMLPGDYVVLCAASDAALFSSIGTVVPVNSMGLTNSGELLMLFNATGDLIDSVDYDDAWYQNNAKDDGGYSLALINPNQLCKGSRNWIVSEASAGGTPAGQNLVYNDALDTLPPSVIQARQFGPNQIYLQFDDVLNKNLAGNSSYYAVDNGAIIITVVCLSETEVILTLGANMVDQTLYTITMTNLEDCVGNSSGVISTTMTYYEAGAATHYDILINEIMADPNPVVGLPEKEYVELYNRSNKTFNLEGFTFTDASSVTAVLPFFILHPGEYITIYSAADTIGFTAFGPVGPTTSFPDLNTSDELILKDQSGEVIDAVSYELFWYQNADKDDGGWSLERVNPDRPCEGASNWRASENLLGGTPSQQNSIYNDVPDDQSPDALRAFPLGGDSIRIYFSEALDDINATQLSNYSIDDATINITSVRLEAPFYNSVILFLDNSLVLGQTYLITMNAALTDCIGNSIALKNTVRVALPEAIQTGDLILNEILFNPVTSNKDFVELYNRSSKVLNSADLVVSNAQLIDGNLANANALQTSPVEVDWLIFPNEYLVITEDADVVKQQYYTPNPESFVENDLPTFGDKEGSVFLYATYDSTYIDTFGQQQVLYMAKVLDLFDYQEDFHSPLIDDKNGVSLERIDFDAKTNDFNNWHSAATGVGYATPAYQNSTFLVNDIIGDDLLELPTETVSPDGDGYEDFLLINYNVDAVGYVANIDIYDASGRLIRNLVNGELLTREGTLQWDGTDNNGRKATVGLHILFVEIFNSQGDVRRFKKTCIVAGKMN